MKINSIMKKKHISKYKLAMECGLPYMTVNDICNGKTNLKNCSVNTVYRLAKVLGVTMEELIEPYVLERPAFNLYRSSICHRLKKMGDINFLIDVYSSGEIFTYYKREWYPECLYLLAMVDYISRVNNIPTCDDYAELRKMKLSDVVYPGSIMVAAIAANDDMIKKKARAEAIPEFIRFNIVESEIRDVI